MLRYDATKNETDTDANIPRSEIGGVGSATLVVFGKVEVVEDQERAMEITRQLSFKYTQDTAYIENEIKHFGDKVLCFALVPEHITGKIVHEA